jgi:hypothetical protein
MNSENNITRRPLKSRDAKWATAIAIFLADSGILRILFPWPAPYLPQGRGYVFGLLVERRTTGVGVFC